MANNPLYDTAGIFYTNLQLLGFEQFKGSPLVKLYGVGQKEIRLDARMFTLSTQPHKATELTLYFLWNGLDIVGFNRSVKIFPPRDHKEAKEFRGLCFKWLEKLKADHHLPPHVALFASDLEESRGESGVPEIEHNYGVFENHPSFELNVIREIIHSESGLYLSRQKSHLKTQRGWLEEGSKLSAMYDEIETKKRKVKEDYESESHLGNVPQGAFTSALESVTSNWNHLETFAKRIEPNLDVVTSVAEDRARRLLIDGEAYKRSLSEPKSVGDSNLSLNGSDSIKLGPLFDAMADKVRCAGPMFNYSECDGLLSTLEPRVKQHTSQLSDLKLLKERLKAEISSLKQNRANP
ncbi:hypothetical protein L0F63_006354, partial [Massospora cicadina]